MSGTNCDEVTIVVNVNSAIGIQIVGRDRVTYKNYVRLGYSRLLRGVYGHPPNTQGLDPWEKKRMRHICLVHATLAAYGHKGAIVCGPTALQVLGVELPPSSEDWDNCHVIFPPGVSRPKRHQVVAHRSIYEPKVWRYIGKLPVLHPVDCLMQITNSDVFTTVEIADGFLRRRNPLLSPDAMKTRIDHLKNKSGCERVKKAMQWVRPGTDSLYETRTRMMIVRAGLPEPVVNLRVYCPTSSRLFHVDLGYESQKLAIEYDGAIHVGNRAQMEIDANRRRLLQDDGWLVIPVTASILRTPEKIIRSVETALSSRCSDICGEVGSQICPVESVVTSPQI